MSDADPSIVAARSEVDRTRARLIATAREFVRNQTRDQIDGNHRLCLSLAQTGFEHSRHAAEAQLAERAFEFNEIHVESPRSGLWSLAGRGFQ